MSSAGTILIMIIAIGWAVVGCATVCCRVPMSDCVKLRPKSPVITAHPSKGGVNTHFQITVRPPPPPPQKPLADKDAV